MPNPYTCDICAKYKYDFNGKNIAAWKISNDNNNSNNEVKTMITAMTRTREISLENVKTTY